MLQSFVMIISESRKEPPCRSLRRAYAGLDLGRNGEERKLGVDGWLLPGENFLHEETPPVEKPTSFDMVIFKYTKKLLQQAIITIALISIILSLCNDPKTNTDNRNNTTMASKVWGQGFFFVLVLFCVFHPQEELGKFGYRSEKKIQIFQHTPIFWQSTETYCLNMAISGKKNPLYVFLPKKFPPKKNSGSTWGSSIW